MIVLQLYLSFCPPRDFLGHRVWAYCSQAPLLHGPHRRRMSHEPGIRAEHTIIRTTVLCRLLVGLLAVFAAPGCSVFMAMDQPKKKDLSVLTPGHSRGAVIAVVGAPKGSGEENGVRSYIFTFKEGSSKLVKLLRAGFYLSADAFMFGLWEPFRMQIEKQFTGSEISVQVYCDSQDRGKRPRSSPVRAWSWQGPPRTANRLRQRSPCRSRSRRSSCLNPFPPKKPVATHPPADNQRTIRRQNVSDRVIPAIPRRSRIFAAEGE